MALMDSRLLFKVSYEMIQYAAVQYASTLFDLESAVYYLLTVKKEWEQQHFQRLQICWGISKSIKIRSAGDND